MRAPSASRWRAFSVGAGVGQPDLRVRHRVEDEVVRQRLAQRTRERPDRGGLRHAAVLPDGVRDLAGAVRRLALRLDPRGQLAPG